jgi:mono/diheme cytochrome c family protein
MRVVLLMALGWLVACGDESPADTGTTIPTETDADTDSDTDADTDADTDTDPPAPATAERGEYLVEHLLLCGDCHTPRDAYGGFDPALELAGVECLVDINGGGADNGGCLNTPNLTNDATGLANRSDAEVVAMFTTGLRPDGEALNPAMPYWIFANLTPTDIDSVVLHLRTVPPVVRVVPASDPLFAVDAPAPALDANKLPVGTGTTGDAETLATGRYLASIACVDCHTPLTNPFDPRSIDEDKLLAGNRDFARDLFGLPPTLPETIYTTNLTPDPKTGIGGWSQLDLFLAMVNGEAPDGSLVCPPMPSAVPEGVSFRGMTPGDANAIALYLLSIPPIANAVTETCSIPAP